MGCARALPVLAVEKAALVAGEAVRAGGKAQRATVHQLTLDLRFLTSAVAPS